MKWYNKEPNKSFINSISKELNIDREKVINVLDSFYNIIIKNLLSIDMFKLPYFGKFIMKKNKKMLRTLDSKIIEI